MSHQRYPSSDGDVKEPHSVSLKVLRLARPSLAAQHPVHEFRALWSSSSSSQQHDILAPASLAYSPASPDVINSNDDDNDDDTPPPPPPSSTTNADPFLLSPILTLPASFGSTYVGETFSCTLCANNNAVVADATNNPGGGDLGPGTGGAGAGAARKRIRNVRIEADMKTPSGTEPVRLELVGAVPQLRPQSSVTLPAAATAAADDAGVVDLEPGATLQRVLGFHLREKGNHVLAVTVSYYEATETSGRSRSFRKLYQFLCKPALVVRTKTSAISAGSGGAAQQQQRRQQHKRRWALEAQLENCSDAALQLDRVFLELEPGLEYEDVNWDAEADDSGKEDGDYYCSGMARPLVQPGEVHQVCFIVSDRDDDDGDDDDDDDDDNDNNNNTETRGRTTRAQETADGRVMFGIMGVGWRGEMGNAGFLSTGRLGSRARVG